MKLKITTLFLLVSILFTVDPVLAEGGDDTKTRFTISGHIRDAETGEDLIGATIYVHELKSGASSNVYGFYSLSLIPGTYMVTFSYIGFESQDFKIELTEDITKNIELNIANQQLDEVVVTSTAINENVTSTEMSAINIDAKTIKKIPAFMGEVDVIKTIQLLPGVQTISEGSSGFSVRGGSMDQNLIQLDEATVYNASHLMGFFSVFNNDAIKDVKLYKGDIPASSGGRLSSLLDVRMKDGNSKGFHATGGIGTISSRLTLEGPIKNDKISYIVSGRRTYADLFLRLSANPDVRDNILYFYDLNGKLNWEINENNRIYFSTYYGNDVFKNGDFEMGWGNYTFTMRWNHLFSKKLFSNITAIHSEFKYHLGVPEGSVNSFKWTSRMLDYGVKADLNYYLNPNNTLRFGVSMIYHRFNPGKATGLGEDAFFTEYEVEHSNALESGIYVSNEQKIGSRLTMKYGLRFSHFQNVGSATVYHYDDYYNVVDSSTYASREFYSPYFGLEPRIGAVYLLNEVSSLKASYSRTRQYIHLAQNSTAGTPLDVWFPSSPNVEPQIADQVAVGYFRNFKDNMIEASVEAYYKYTQNAIDFKDHADLLLNKEYEGELRFGEAQAYGLEFLVRYNFDKFSGWVGYTLSHTERTIVGIHEGKPFESDRFPASYDRPHDISVVLNYDASERVSIGANWVYSTGQAVTFPTGKFEYGNVYTPIFSDRNGYRMPDYHRLDVSATLRSKDKPGRKFYHEWNLSVYNAYARKNPWVINFVQDEDNPSKTHAEMTYLFSIIPAITFNFHF
ncbi:MAG TPA: TonB-dependent receptor [Bacteroidales bacterium]|nr:TonB-dependent receptor [Bacteroidales bacterium]HRX96784.1 TonB-dependent receptor [Bacteroidales bacterium]